MKKGLVILMALAFIGGVAFAEDGMGPDITFGVDSYAGVNVFTNNTDLEPTGNPTDQAAVSKPLVGPLKDDGDYGYWMEPWVKLESGAFSAKLAPMFYGAGVSGNDIAFSRYELTLGLAGTGYGLYDRMRYEVKEGVPGVTIRHRIKGDFDMDNLSAGLVFDSGGVAIASTSMDTFFVPYYSLAFTDLQSTISDIWGFMDVKVGGYSTSYYHTNDYRLQAIDWFSSDDDNVASDNVADTGFRYVGLKNGSLPINTTFNIGNLVESVPLTIRTGVNAPLFALEWRDALAYDATSYPFIPIIASAEFMMEGIGDFVLGAIPGFAYTVTDWDGANYTNYTTDVTNNIFLDANISAIESLQLQASFDYGTQTADTVDPAGIGTGAGTAASPFTTAKVTTTMINFGVEAVYDLSSVLEGLEVDGALAIASLSGRTDLNQTGTAYVAPTAGAGIYIAPNYNEASGQFGQYTQDVPVPVPGYGAPTSFIFGVGVSYDIDDNNSVSVSNEFDSMAGDFSAIDAAMGTTSYGFYNKDKISLGYSTTVGGGKFSVGLGYTMYLGVPTAADYQITGADNIAAYDAAAANAFKPLSAYVKYTTEF